MKKCLSKINVSPILYIVVFLSLISGLFKEIIVFILILIIHELGHIITGLHFKYKLDKVIIYPYGGMTKFNTIINTNINKDILVAISGVIVQSIYFILITILYTKGYIREYIYNLFTIYNKSILLFNILPIIPLDGSKIINLILSKYLYYNLSNKLTIIISFITIIIILITRIYEYNYSFIIILGILMKNIYDFYKNLEYIYNKFLLERYLYKITYPKKKIIKNKKKMYKNKFHYFYINNQLLKEDDYLRSIYSKR